MLTAIVLIDVDVSRVPEACQEVADIDGVSEVYSVTGDIDVVALVRVKSHDELARIVADKIGKVPGILDTRTYIAFQTYSRRELDQAFALGAD